jgi:hypothetical protein
VLAPVVRHLHEPQIVKPDVETRCVIGCCGQCG